MVRRSGIEPENIRILQGKLPDCIRNVAGTPSPDIIFADPPYALEDLATLPEKVFAKDILHPGAYFILEHPEEYNFGSHPYFIKEKKYGNVHFSFFEMPSAQ